MFRLSLKSLDQLSATQSSVDADNDRLPHRAAVGAAQWSAITASTPNLAHATGAVSAALCGLRQCRLSSARPTTM
jgi:hypothetical protein